MPWASAAASAFCWAAVLTGSAGTATCIGPVGEPMGSGESIVAVAMRPVSGLPDTDGARVTYSWLGLPVVGSTVPLGSFVVAMHLEPSGGPLDVPRMPLPSFCGVGADGGGNPQDRVAPIPAVPPPPEPAHPLPVRPATASAVRPPMVIEATTTAIAQKRTRQLLMFGTMP